MPWRQPLAGVFIGLGVFFCERRSNVKCLQAPASAQPHCDPITQYWQDGECCKKCGPGTYTLTPPLPERQNEFGCCRCRPSRPGHRVCEMLRGHFFGEHLEDRSVSGVDSVSTRRRCALLRLRRRCCESRRDAELQQRGRHGDTTPRGNLGKWAGI